MRYASLFMLGLTCVCFSACDTPELPQRRAASGRVTLDGKPLADGSIRFVSVQRGGDVTTIIQGGQFDFDAESGPFVGEYDVAITPFTPELPEVIAAIQSGNRDPLKNQTVPAKYHGPGLLKATVKPDGDNRFEFVLSSR